MIDITALWASHTAIREAIRASTVDAFFVTYATPGSENASAWASARSPRPVMVVPFKNSSQFGTAAHGLRLLPTYEYYVLTRTDVTCVHRLSNPHSFMHRLPQPW